MTHKELATSGNRAARRSSRWTKSELSEVEQAEHDVRLAIELAAASLELEFASTLAQAVEARPDISRQMLAACLRVSEGRVSQVLNGEDAPRAATLARYMRALGYSTHVHAVPAEPAAPPLVVEERPTASRRVISRTIHSPRSLTIRYVSSDAAPGSEWENTPLIYVHAERA